MYAASLLAGEPDSAARRIWRELFYVMVDAVWPVRTIWFGKKERKDTSAIHSFPQIVNSLKHGISNLA